MSETYVRARINSQLKEEATAIFDKIGISMSDFIRIALTRAVLEKGVPFEMKIPNEQTRRAIDDVISRRTSTSYISNAKNLGDLDDELRQL